MEVVSICMFVVIASGKCLRVWRIIIVITWWAHKSQKFTLGSIKVMRIWKYLITINRIFKHKEVVSNLHVCSNGLGKMSASNIFHFSPRILTSKPMKIFNNFFCIIYDAMSNKQLSGLDNDKITCQTHKY